MAYIMRHTDKSGKVNVERVMNLIAEKVYGAMPAAHEHEHNAAVKIHAEMLKKNRPRNGFTGRKKVFRHIATIPTSESHAIRSEIPIHDSKALKRWIKKNQFNTVRSTSF